MLPILVRLGPLTIYSFGVFLCLAVVLASFLVWKKARSVGLPEEKVFDTLLLALFVGLLAGRIGYTLTHGNVFGADVSRIFLFNHYPGLSFATGFSAGLVTAWVSAKAAQLDAWQILDFFCLAFSWALLVGLAGGVLDGSVPAVFILPAVLLALLLTAADRRIRSRAVLIDLARRPGLEASAYLIFLLTSFLIVDRAARQEEKILYLAIFLTALITFMVKFPASVLSQIKSYLENKYRDSEKRIRELKKEDPFSDNARLMDRASDDSEAQSKAGHERIAAMQQQLNMILVQTRKALTKIKIGKYGICENCGKMIDTDRLSVMPTATLCLSCEKKREK